MWLTQFVPDDDGGFLFGISFCFENLLMLHRLLSHIRNFNCHACCFRARVFRAARSTRRPSAATCAIRASLPARTARWPATRVCPATTRPCTAATASDRVCRASSATSTRPPGRARARSARPARTARSVRPGPCQTFRGSRCCSSSPRRHVAVGCGWEGLAIISHQEIAEYFHIMTHFQPSIFRGRIQYQRHVHLVSRQLWRILSQPP
jgi:hypothetical protein